MVTMLGYAEASGGTNDPPVVVPPRVNQVVDYYQRNNNLSLSLASVSNSYCLMEALFNLWGDPQQIVIPAGTLSSTVPDPSSLGVGHGEVPLWFSANLAGLNSGGPPPNLLPPWPVAVTRSDVLLANGNTGSPADDSHQRMMTRVPPTNYLFFPHRSRTPAVLP